jgi:hypothetical protein
MIPIIPSGARPAKGKAEASLNTEAGVLTAVTYAELGAARLQPVSDDVAAIV